MTEKKEVDQIIFPKAVIFDMDGTLIDSTKLDFLAWKRLFSLYNKNITFEEYIPLLGIKSAKVVQEYLHLDDEEEIQNALAKKLVFFKDILAAEGIEPIPFSDVFLRQVKNLGVPVALATSSRPAKMKMVMERLDLLSQFDVIVTGAEVQKGKPEPDIFLMAAEKLGVAPEDCLVFEDANNGVMAAKRAGMKCIALSSHLSKEAKEKADLVIESFENVSLPNLCFLLKT